MIRTPARSVRVGVGVALVGVAGALTLAGCSGTSAPAAADGGNASGAPAAGGAAAGPYADGTYTAKGSYATPETVETISVTLTIADDTVSDVEVAGDPQAAETQKYQSQFIGGISGEVVGKKLDEISVTRVAGSSLTSGGFMQALELIKAEAAS